MGEEEAIYYKWSLKKILFSFNSDSFCSLLFFRFFKIGRFTIFQVCHETIRRFVFLSSFLRFLTHCTAKSAVLLLCKNVSKVNMKLHQPKLIKSSGISLYLLKCAAFLGQISLFLQSLHCCSTRKRCWGNFHQTDLLCLNNQRSPLRPT